MIQVIVRLLAEGSTSGTAKSSVRTGRGRSRCFHVGHRLELQYPTSPDFLSSSRAHARICWEVTVHSLKILHWSYRYGCVVSISKRCRAGTRCPCAAALLRRSIGRHSQAIRPIPRRTGCHPGALRCDRSDHHRPVERRCVWNRRQSYPGRTRRLRSPADVSLLRCRFDVSLASAVEPALAEASDS